VLGRMQRFANMSDFKKAAIRLVVCHLEKEGDLHGMKVMFGGMDVRNCGKLEDTDVLSALKGHGADVTLEDVRVWTLGVWTRHGVRARRRRDAGGRAGVDTGGMDEAQTFRWR